MKLEYIVRSFSAAPSVALMSCGPVFSCLCAFLAFNCYFKKQHNKVLLDRAGWLCPGLAQWQRWVEEAPGQAQ